MNPKTGHRHRCALSADTSERIDTFGLQVKSVVIIIPRHPALESREFGHVSNFSGSDTEDLAVSNGPRAQRLCADLSLGVPRLLRVELHAARPPPECRA